MVIENNQDKPARRDQSLIIEAKREAQEWASLPAYAKRPSSPFRVLSGRANSALWTLYETIMGPGSTPADIPAQLEARRHLEKGITRLTAMFRRVVVMHDLDGQPIEDVASAVNRSEGATYMLRARAHRRLRIIMQAEPRHEKRPARSVPSRMTADVSA